MLNHIAMATALLSMSMSTVQAAEGTSYIEGWQVEDRINELTDVRSVIISKEDISSSQSLFRRPTLVIGCTDGATNVMILRSHVYNPYTSTEVTTRIDKNPTTTEVWTVLHEGVISRTPFSLIEKLSGAKKFITKVKAPYSRSEIATFNVTGLEAALAPVRDACKR